MLIIRTNEREQWGSYSRKRKDTLIDEADRLCCEYDSDLSLTDVETALAFGF